MNTSMIDAFDPNSSLEDIIAFKDIIQKILMCKDVEENHQTACDNSHLNVIFLGYGFPVMLVLCLLGNSMNILVYSVEYLRKNVAVKLLAAKALANTLFVLSLMPNGMRLLLSWDSKSRWEVFYWKIWPFLLFLANTFGTCAMWLTVAMTLERYLYVVYPVNSKAWCTNRNFYRFCQVIVPLAAVLQMVYPIARKVEPIICDHKTFYRFVIRNGTIYTVYESIYHWLNLSCVIMVPLIALIAMSAVIAWKLCRRPRFNNRRTTNEQFRCVTLITLSTTATHVLLELPAVGLFVAAALEGPQVINQSPTLCAWNVGANFLALCNASLLFCIYFAFSRRFRQLFVLRLRCRPSTDQPRSARSSLATREVLSSLREQHPLLVGTPAQNKKNSRSKSSPSIQLNTIRSPGELTPSLADNGYALRTGTDHLNFDESPTVDGETDEGFLKAPDPEIQNRRKY